MKSVLSRYVRVKMVPRGGFQTALRYTATTDTGIFSAVLYQAELSPSLAIGT